MQIRSSKKRVRTYRFQAADVRAWMESLKQPPEEKAP